MPRRSSTAPLRCRARSHPAPSRNARRCDAMASLLESKFGFGLVCLFGAALAVTGVVYLRSDPVPAAPAPAPVDAASWDNPLGPGALAALARSEGLAAPASGEQPLLDAGG